VAAVSEGSAVVGPPRGPGRTEGAIVAAGTVGRFGTPSAPPSAPGAVTADAALATRLVESSLLGGPFFGAPSSSTTSGAAQQPSHPHAHSMSPPPAAKPSLVPTIPEPVPTDSEPTPSAPAAPTPPKPGLTAEQLSQPLAKLAPSLQTCAHKTNTGVVFVNEQDLTLEISPAGKATLVAAEPGLDTADRACWGLVVSALSFPAAEGSTMVKRHVVVGSN
jgi:hypothetical protein